MKSQRVSPPIRAIVLAGGDGTRLQDLTRKIDGDSRPKQFSRIFGNLSLLGHTRERLQRIFRDDEVLFVVTKDHRHLYTEELTGVHPSRILEQPVNRGTGVAIIAALLQLLEHDVDAIVGIFPSDHYYADNTAFAETVNSAINISNEHNDSIVLIGAKPEWPEVEFGWIEPAAAIQNRTCTSLFGVSGFCEKPPLSTARSLMREGGLWNTFITIGRAGAFLKLLTATVMSSLSRLAEAIASGDLETTYGDIETIDFSKHVLSADPSALLVLADGGSGWADLGNPSRVIETLDRNEIEPDWLREMRRLDVPPQINSQRQLRRQMAHVVMQNTATA